MRFAEAHACAPCRGWSGLRAAGFHLQTKASPGRCARLAMGKGPFPNGSGPSKRREA